MFFIWASLLAQKTKRPVKIRLFRDDDQEDDRKKRHRYLNEFKVGYNGDGSIKALQTTLNADGSATDLSMAVLERAMISACRECILYSSY